MSAGDGRESDGREVLILSEGETVLHGLLQVRDSVRTVPCRTVDMDDKLAGQGSARSTNSSCRDRDSWSPFGLRMAVIIDLD